MRFKNFNQFKKKKFSKFSDLRVQKQLKEEDMNGSLDNINPAEFREGKTNIELISDNSYVDNDVSSSLSSDDDKQNNETKKRKYKIKKDAKIINSNSLNSQGLAKFEKNSNKNVYVYNNNDIDENYFKNDIAFFRSPQIYSNRTSNKSLISDPKGDFINNFMLNMNDSVGYNIDNFNKNYALENMLNKSIIKKLGSLNSNIDFDKENEDENEINEKQNRANNYFDNPKNLNNLNIQEQIHNLKISEQNIDNFNKGNIKNIENTNFMNENSNMINNIQKNNKNNEAVNNIINNFSQNTDFDLNCQRSKSQNIKTINIINNNINSPNLNNISFNNLIGSPNQSNIINIQNMNNYNNNNFILNPNQINPNNSPNNNITFDYNNTISHNRSLNESSPYMFRKNNLYDFNANIEDKMIQNIYGYLNNNNLMNNLALNQLNQQNYLMNQRNNIEYMNNIYQNKPFINNQNQIQQNPIINSKMNNIYNSNNIYNHQNSNNNIYANNNLNQNYSNFNNLNIISQNNNNYQQNIQYNDNSQLKKKNKSNYYQKNNLMNQNNINISNNPNYIMNNQNNNYNYLNKNINHDFININNNDYNNLINPKYNINYYQNLSNSNFYKNVQNNQNLNLYPIINGIPYLNNNNINYNSNNNNNQNKRLNSNKQRKQNYNSLSNEELAKQAFNIAKNQNGCRYLQKRVENNKELVPTLFFPNILGHFQALSNDQFGNYYIKIIIKYLPSDMIYKLISLMHPYFGVIGTNQYGTKVIQYLIEFLTDEKNLIFFIEKIIPHIVSLISDLNGIHIVQKLISIKTKYIQLIFNTIYNNIELIAITRDGSIFIIKKLFDLLDENNLVFLLNSINQKLDKIIIDQYGNYLIQNIITKFNIMLKYQIIENIIKNLVKYSIQKFSSNVVEKCFDTELGGKVIDEILKNNNLETILLNDYGNYVIQKALNKADKNKQNLLLKALVPLVDKLQKMQFGQKLLQKLFITYPKLSIYILNC